MIQKKSGQPKEKATPKPKFTDAERHKRFVDMAHEVEADESSESFDAAFENIVANHKNIKKHRK